MAYRIQALPHESPSRSFPTASLSNVIFHTAAQQLTRFQLTQCIMQFLCSSGASCSFSLWSERWTSIKDASHVYRL